MRLIDRSLAAALLFCAGCPEDPDSKEFTIASPASGTSLDRCNVRVLTTPPVLGATWGPGGSGIETAEHVNWRIDGGREYEVKPQSVNIPGRANFAFGVTLVDGSQTLEVASCDAFDRCEYKPVRLTVTNASGTPDCTAPHGGQLLLPERQAYNVTPLADGRVIVQVASKSDFGLLMVKPDGSLDETFGMLGRAPLPLFPDHVAPLSDGSFLVVGAGFYMAHVSATGVMDTSFGNADNTPGVRLMPCPQGSGCVAGAMRADGSGGVVIAGTSSSGSYVMRLDASFAAVDSAVVDATAHDALAIEASGRALFASQTDVIVGGLSGLETTFGTAGHVAIPADPNGTGAKITGGALVAGNAVVARTVFAGNVKNLEILPVVAGVAKPIVTIPIVTTPAIYDNAGVARAAIDSLGRAYVTIGKEGTVPTGVWYSADAPNTDLLVARLVGGALDPSFGTAGISTFSARDVWSPIATEAMAEAPKAIVMGIDDKPWLVSVSSGFGTYTDPNILRGPGVVLSKIKP